MNTNIETAIKRNWSMSESEGDVIQKFPGIFYTKFYIMKLLPCGAAQQGPFVSYE